MFFAPAAPFRRLSHALLLAALASLATTPALAQKRSTDSEVATNIVFSNASRAPVKVFWVDFDGKEVAYFDLPPGEQNVQQTYTGHWWRVRDASNGKLLREIANDGRQALTVRVEAEAAKPATPPVATNSTMPGGAKPPVPTTYNPAQYTLANTRLSAGELRLYELLMNYRAQRGLPRIPLSQALTYTAQVHAWDTVSNRPNQGSCNMHSWSNNGSWRGMCYTGDHRAAEFMWSKPKELANYPSQGFEISFGSSGYRAEQIPAQALSSWQGSPGHNSVIINSDIWQNSQWKAIGVGIYNGYSHVWFGEKADSASPAMP